MEHFVPLEKLPPGLEFPPEYRDRIRFDPEKQRLVYRGFMSKADFDRLCRLSGDWSYRRPLENLFRLCAIDASEKPRGLRGLVTSLISRLA